MYDVSLAGLFNDFSHPNYAGTIGSLLTDHMDSWDGASYGVPYAHTTGGPWAYNFFDLSGNKCGLFEWFIDNERSAEYFSPNNLGSLQQIMGMSTVPPTITSSEVTATVPG